MGGENFAGTRFSCVLLNTHIFTINFISFLLNPDWHRERCLKFPLSGCLKLGA
jgi:hypothetical protein